jgi:hypothetical protein
MHVLIVALCFQQRMDVINALMQGAPSYLSWFKLAEGPSA